MTVVTPAQPATDTGVATTLAGADAGAGPASVAWTCPFCPLLCDAFHAAPATPGGSLALVGGDCPRADAALARFGPAPAACSPRIGGQPCDLEAAVAAAARLLAASRQPLFGGLGTDVAGARALYRLACRTGAIADAAHGAALQQGLSALQGKGGFTTTLAEVRSRADLIVCIGGLPTDRYPKFFDRCGVGDAAFVRRRIVVVGGDAAEPSATAAPPIEVNGVAVETVPLQGDLFDTVAQLAARVDGRHAPSPGGTPPSAIDQLAASLHAAAYAVVVWQAPRLPAHGALLIEAIDRIVATLNRRSRAAAFALGGDDGGSTVNAVFGWLSGLPLRSRAGPRGLEHEPLRFDAARLLAGGEVDALLWVASFGSEPAPPPAALPTVVLGHPRWFDRSAAAADTVFIPVSTPGIGSAGHLFRSDGAVLMPLSPLYADTLPTVADVAGRLARAVAALRADADAEAALPA